MKLKTRKQLLNVASLGCLLVAGWVVLRAWTAPLPTFDAKSGTSNRGVSQGNAPQAGVATVDQQHPSWQRRLRRPLYDPPPKPKVVVKKKPRPIPVKVTGTILEAENSQAFVKMANGSVELRRVGDQVTNDPLDGLVSQITASGIVIKRGEEEIPLNIDNRN